MVVDGSQRAEEDGDQGHEEEAGVGKDDALHSGRLPSRHVGDVGRESQVLHFHFSFRRHHHR